ncbi:MCE family protein [Rhodococcus sp. KBS0724]|uniref:MCE family protein n=1 Tax=Rhodococcus sp. KBS0724 TaxID=1179674 RepID=UPI0021B140A2|nr:MCE family protein [Rhodococcus sp. KBS0724]
MRSLKSMSKVVLVVVVATAGCSGLRSAASMDETITVTAQFDSGAGLYEGNAVSVLGVPIGSVISIVPRGTFVEVTMSLDGGVKIPEAAQAVTVSTSVLTDRHVEITPPYQDGPVMTDGDIIATERTKTPVEFDRLIAMADKMAIELQGDGEGSGPVADLLGVGSAMVDGNGQAIRSSLSQLASALQLGSDGGVETQNAITTVVDNLSVLTSVAASNDQDIREFGSALAQVSDLLGEADLGSGDTGTKVNQILVEADKLLATNRGTLQSTVTNANTVVTALADYRRELSEFLTVTPLLMDNAYNAIDQENGGARVHAQLEKVFLDGQLVKEICNVLGLRQLGCSTGTLEDFGPDFGISGMLEGLAGLPR